MRINPKIIFALDRFVIFLSAQISKKTTIPSQIRESSLYKKLIDLIIHFLELLKIGWHIMLPIISAVFILLLGYFFYFGNDQADDMFVSLIQDSWNKYNTTVLISVFLWSVFLWFYTIDALSETKDKYAFQWSDSEKTMFEKHYSKISHRLSTILGVMPFIIVLCSLIKATIKVKASMFFLYFDTTIYALLTMVFYALYNFLYPHWQDVLAAKSLTPMYQRVIFFFFVLIQVFFFIIFGGFTQELGFAEWLGPGTIIGLALTSWSVLILKANSLGFKHRVPIFMGVLMLCFVSGFFNNNHLLRVTGDLSSTDRRLDQNYFDSWLTTHSRDLLSNLKLDSFGFKNNFPSSKIPVFIIAAEGGGIRSSLWTSTVLSRLQERFPSFYKHTFALSGASGGSVGIQFFASLQRDAALDNQFNCTLDTVERIASGDFLSSLTGSLCYTDLIQRVIPCPIYSFDRARRLEDAFSIQYKKFTKKNTLDLGLAKAFNTADCRFPALFFNSTVVESGQKAIWSNVKLSEGIFHDAYDVLDYAKKDFAIKTAATSSARFPFITPPGLLYDSQKQTRQFVDGGYFDNTGLHTAFQVFQLIKKRCVNTLDNKDTLNFLRKSIYPVILFIKNGNDELNYSQVGSLYELSPINAFYNAWDRRAISTYDDLLKYSWDTRSCSVMQITLNRKNVALPLGWYLSDVAKFDIINQAKEITLNNPQKMTHSINRLVCDSIEILLK
jgi:hypothetical protein